MEAEGDPTVFNLSLKILKSKSAPMMKLIKYNPGKHINTMMFMATSPARKGEEYTSPEITLPGTVENIYISNSVVQISNYAFSNCQNVKSLEFEQNSQLQSIGDYAFKQCSLISSINVPNSVKLIGGGAFEACIGLTEITIPFIGNKDTDFNSTHQLPFGFIFGQSSYSGTTRVSQRFYYTSTTSTSAYYFYIPSKLKTVTVTGGKINSGAFYNCSFIQNIILGEGVTAIDKDAFYGCTITELKLPNSLKSLNKNALYNLTFTNFVLPNGLEYLGVNSLPKVTNLCINKTLDEWCNMKLENSDASPWCYTNNVYFVSRNGSFTYDDISYDLLPEKLVIPNTVTKLEDYVFASFSGLKTVIFNSNLEETGVYTFANCKNLTSVAINQKITKIANSFYNCYNLVSVYYDGTINDWCQIQLMDSIISSRTGKFYIKDESGSYTFNETNYILPSTIDVPNNIDKIGSYQFSNFTSIRYVNISSSITEIGDYALQGLSLSSFSIPLIVLCWPGCVVALLSSFASFLQRISLTSELFPEPETPVTQVKTPRGTFTLIFLRLFSSAPIIDKVLPLPVLLLSGTGIFLSPERYLPVIESLQLIISSAVPAQTISPP
jgi:flagellar basal body rod protein FlgG